MAAIKSNDSLLSFEMKLIAKGKTNACFVTPQSLSGDFIALNTPKQDSIMLIGYSPTNSKTGAQMITDGCLAAFLCHLHSSLTSSSKVSLFFALAFSADR